MILSIRSPERFAQLRKIAGSNPFSHDLIDTLEALQSKYKSAAGTIHHLSEMMLEDMREPLELLPPTISAPFGSVRVSEPKCICAQGVTKCPQHGEQPAKRELCPRCGAVLAYCMEGEYCTKEECRYAL